MNPDTPAHASNGGVYDPMTFRKFSAEKANVVRMYSDEDLTLVVWNLEPGQENDLHRHAENAHALIILEGEGLYVRGDGTTTPVKAGECVVVPRQQPHGIRNTGSTRLSYFAITNQGSSGYVRDSLAGQGPTH